MGQIIAAPLNGARGRGPGNICAFRLADRDLDRLLDLAERKGLLNMSAAIRLAVAAGLETLEHGEPEPLESG
jgi:hypothetical protein